MVEDFAFDDAARLIDDLQDGAGGDAFSAAAFTDHAEGLVLVDGKVDPVDGLNGTLVEEKVCFEILYFNEYG